MSDEQDECPYNEDRASCAVGCGDDITEPLRNHRSDANRDMLGDETWDRDMAQDL